MKKKESTPKYSASNNIFPPNKVSSKYPSSNTDSITVTDHISKPTLLDNLPIITNELNSIVPTRRNKCRNGISYDFASKKLLVNKN